MSHIFFIIGAALGGFIGSFLGYMAAYQTIKKDAVRTLQMLNSAIEHGWRPH